MNATHPMSGYVHLTSVAVRTALAALLLGSLAACGFRGPLYLPSEARDIVTRPAQTPPAETGQSPDSPRTPDSPVEPASPAPEVGTPPADEDTTGKDRDKHGAPPPKT
jgi:predicted small lipoprotein YifL